MKNGYRLTATDVIKSQAKKNKQFNDLWKKSTPKERLIGLRVMWRNFKGLNKW